jgi:hypothetical protein
MASIFSPNLRVAHAEPALVSGREEAFEGLVSERPEEA